MVISHQDFTTTYPARYPSANNLHASTSSLSTSRPHDSAGKAPLDAAQEEFRALSPVLDSRDVGPLRSTYTTTPDHLPILTSSYPQLSSHHLQVDPYYLQHTYGFTPTNHSYDTSRIARVPHSGEAPHPTSHPLALASMPVEAHQPLTIPSLLPNNHAEQDANSVVPVLPMHHDAPTDMVQDTAGSSHAQQPARGSAAKKEASMVVIACRQCRARKIRCDSTRPSCNSCVRRSNECQYDTVPKRRGPDKRPGTRQRSCKKRPVDNASPPKKKSKKNPEDQGQDFRLTTKENLGLKVDVTCLDRRMNGSQHTIISSTPLESVSNQMQLSPPSSLSPSTTVSPYAPGHSLVSSPDTLSMPSSLDNHNLILHQGMESNAIASSHQSLLRGDFTLARRNPAEVLHVMQTSGTHFSHTGWWEDLLDMYAGNREQSEREIEADLTFLFSSSNYWLFFINEELFFQTLSDELARQTMQPSLVLAGLALATLMKSSELGFGKAGRERALWLRDLAQSRLDSSWQASFIDTALAAAAMTLAIFETSAHPEHTPDRACSALIFLDDIIHALALTTIDARDPEASIFMPRAVPSVPRTYQSAGDSRCRCGPPMHLPSLLGRENHQMSLPGWDPSWSVEEVRQEETRRLCWSALTLAATHTTHCTAFQTEPLDLFLTKPENYALLFPGENSRRSDDTEQPPKESVWALYCRSMLLWNGCLQLRNAPSTDGEKAEFAFRAFMETRDIEDAIDAHVCTSNSHIIHLAREYISNTRITITREFRRLCNLDSIKHDRHQSEEWLSSQTSIAESFQFDVHNTRDSRVLALARRPFYVWWFMSQVTISMSIWVTDKSLVQSLILCKAYLVPLDFLTALWPCPAQRERYLQLRHELTDNCLKAGLSPPPPADFTLPLPVHV